jgi:hypothetical protein
MRIVLEIISKFPTILKGRKMPHRCTIGCTIEYEKQAFFYKSIDPVENPLKGTGMTTTSRFVKLGQPAPEFTLPAVDGRQVALQDYRGQKHVVLVFLRGFM